MAPYGVVSGSHSTHTLYQTLTIAFKAPPSTSKSLLLYGQLLGGVFHPQKRQFLAVCLGDGAVSIFWSLSTAKRILIELKGKYNNNKWHALAILANGGEVSGSVRADIDNPSIMRENSAGSGCTSGPGSGFFFDSGLHIGAVVDCMSVTAYPKINGQLELFSGQIHSSIFINGAVVDLEDTAKVVLGITDDAIGKYMSDVLKYDLKQSLPKLEPVDLHPTDPTMLKF